LRVLLVCNPLFLHLVDTDSDVNLAPEIFLHICVHFNFSNLMHDAML